MADKPKPAPRRGPSTATKVLLAITVLGAFAFVALIGVAVFFATRAPTGEVAEGSFLRIQLQGDIADAPSQGALFVEPDDLPPVPTDIVRAIRKAGTDERIKGIYLELDQIHLGLAVAQEMREALTEFRKSGKPCVVYAEGYMTGDYYLASACDRVVIAPSGVAMVAGLSASITYYAGTFEKIGVAPQFEHVGEFKSAVEPYERTSPSDGALEATNSFLDSIWTRMVADIAASRGRSIEDIQALVDLPPMSPQDALTRGLVDALAYRDQVEARLPDAQAADWPAKLAEPLVPPEDEDAFLEERFTSLSEYIKDVHAEDAAKSDFVAIIHAEGPIVSGKANDGLFADQVLADGPFHEWMREAREDETVKAVVLRVNSPGGSGLASDMMWREVELTKAAGKPVVVSMANYAASGGYYIACGSDWIVADPSTLTGSIGVFGGKLAIAGTFEKVGLTQYTFKRGNLADMLSITQPFSDDGRQVFRSYLEGFYQQFLGRVADGRHKTKDEIHEVARGRVWTGEQAIELGLVDELGGLDTAVKKAAELGKIEDYGLKRLPRQKTFVDLLVEDLQRASASEVELDITPELPGIDEALGHLILLDRILGDDGIAAYNGGLPRF